MKTYNQYLKIIRDREYKEGEPERKRQAEMHKAHKPMDMCACFSSIGNVDKMTFDYSVEIMGMMMQDFLEEFNQTVSNIPNFQFDENGSLLIKEMLDDSI